MKIRSPRPAQLPPWPFWLQDARRAPQSETAAAPAAAEARDACALITAQDEVVRDVMELTRVDGLGDEAYFARRTMSYVRKGDALLSFRTAGLHDPAREHWEALARVALGRL